MEGLQRIREENAMGIQIVKKFPSLEFSNHKAGKPSSRFVKSDSAKPENGHLLHLYVSLMAPKTVPLIQLQTEELKAEQVCKFDWHFGICNHPNDWNFDWLKELRSVRSLAVQLVIEVPKEIEFTEVYSDMMGLQPLNQTLERKPDFLQVATNVGVAIAPNRGLATLLESLGTEREKTKMANDAYMLARRFMMYRYVDNTGRRGIEWLLTKDMVSEWGSLLRGSVYIAFYGTGCRGEKENHIENKLASQYAKITLNTRLGFLDKDLLCYIPEGQPKQSTCVVDVELMDQKSLSNVRS